MPQFFSEDQRAEHENPTLDCLLIESTLPFGESDCTRNDGECNQQVPYCTFSHSARTVKSDNLLGVPSGTRVLFGRV